MLDAPSTWLKYSRGALLVFVVGAAYAALAVWLAPPAPALPDDVSFSVGGLTIVKSRAVVESNATIGASEAIPVRVRMENGKLVCDVFIRGPSGGPLIQIVGSRAVSIPPNWDVNYSERAQIAVEVVDERQRPVFQLIQKTQWQYVINGVVPDRGRYLIANDQRGTLVSASPQVPASMALKPIFKYPSFNHLGEFAAP